MYSNNMNTEVGNRFSFISLLRDQNYRIEIPIIQRDYAQGRKSAKNVRNIFLTALHDYLEEGKPSRDLDFVYGSIKLKNDIAHFIPLDGQQRLTTLFLLHWYLALTSSEEKFKQFQNDAAVNDNNRWTSKFSYEVRTSSKEFCNSLMTFGLDLNNLLPEFEEKQVSKTIQNKGWYFSSWNADPTVKAMLNMLDSIHRIFKGKKEFYDLLVDFENPVITFLFLNLKEFKLTDDLYIKMNARGKPLTDFENFKAKFEQYAEQLPWTVEDQKKFEFDGVVRNVTPKEYFSFQIDTTWADLFWNYRELIGKADSYDEELMNFIRVILSANYCEQNKTDINLEFLLGTQVAKQSKEYTDELTFQHYFDFNAIDKESIQKLITAFDVLVKDHQIGTENTVLNTYFDNKQVFSNVLKHELNQVDRVRFYAYVSYLKLELENNSGIENWMRVIYNLTENTVIDSGSDVSKAIVSINKMISNAPMILDYLRQEESNIDFFANRQIVEERIKAHLLLHEDWKFTLLKVEKHAYFRGQIGFLLSFSGVIQYYHAKKNCDWSIEENSQLLANFKNYCEKASSAFKFERKDGEPSYLHNYEWERAVLCQGDYLIKGSSDRRNFLSTSRNMRDFSWKRLLRISASYTSADAEDTVQENGRDFVKAVFDNRLFDPKDLHTSLEKICQETILTDWRKYFVEEPRLIQYCQQGFIRWESKEFIKLYKQSQQNHTQSELRTYNFYLKELKDNYIIHPFTKAIYQEAKHGGEAPYIALKGLLIESKKYQLHIYFLKNELNSTSYQLYFVQELDGNSEEKFPEKLKSELVNIGFAKDVKNGFRAAIKEDIELKELILIMNEKLNQLSNTELMTD